MMLDTFRDFYGEVTMYITMFFLVLGSLIIPFFSGAKGPNHLGVHQVS